MRGQLGQALDNLETVLKQADFTLADVVRLNYYTTDVDGFVAAGCRPAATLLGVARLFIPEQLVELEATAMA